MLDSWLPMNQIPFSHLATLSRLNPTAKGITSDGFESVVAYVDTIQQYATEAVPLFANINTVRDDVAISATAQTVNRILEQFPDRQLNMLKVPNIF